ncbi:MAG: serine hydrolase [Myxococcales bacterium]|nr:serine hydrolase [Myxococcales bacterium]
MPGTPLAMGPSMTLQQALALVLVATSIGCAAAPPSPPPTTVPAPAAPAPKPSPLDPKVLDRILSRAEESLSDALVIQHDGALVGSWTFGKPEGPIEAMSVTKSVVSLAVGAALRTGAIPSLDVPAHRYFPEWRRGPHAAITLRHLLDNTSGLEANRTTEAIYASGDFVRFALEAEVVEPPGTKFRYNNKAYNLVPAILEQATGEPIDRFLSRTVLAPLGVAPITWSRDPAGHCQGMAGLQIRPVDLAKLGQLMLDGGVHDGERLLDATWVAESTKPGPVTREYSLGWWLLADREIVLDAPLFAEWRSQGVDEELIELVAPMKDRPYEKRAFFAELERRLAGHGGLDRWHATTWKQGRRDGHVRTLEQRGYAGDGYLGQHLLVLPEERLVVVRMRRWSEGTEGVRDYDFVDLRDLAKELLRR